MATVSFTSPVFLRLQIPKRLYQNRGGGLSSVSLWAPDALTRVWAPDPPWATCGRRGLRRAHRRFWCLHVQFFAAEFLVWKWGWEPFRVWKVTFKEGPPSVVSALRRPCFEAAGLWRPGRGPEPVAKSSFPAIPASPTPLCPGWPPASALGLTPAPCSPQRGIKSE